VFVLRRITITALFLAVGAPAPCADPPKLLNQQDMLALIADALKAWDVPGVAIAIVDRNSVLWLHGDGIADIDSRKPMTHETLFPLASCSKGFTATLIAMLADEGKLSWDDPIRRYWPEFRLADSMASEAATFRDLMTHRTGLASHDYLWYRATWPPEDGVRRAGLLPLEKPFRTAFQYQSTMVTAAGLAAARAAKDQWDHLIQTRIFEPLHMRTARCTTPPPTANRASPHRVGRDGKLHVVDWYEQTVPNPAGSIHASAADLVGWLQFQLSNGTIGDKKLLSARQLAETHTPQMALRLEGIYRAVSPESLMMSYSLGWTVQDYRGHLLVSHAGALDGFRAHITLIPNNGLAFAILSNRHQTRMNLALSNMLVDRLVGLPARDWNGYFRDVGSQEDAAAATTKELRKKGRRPDLTPSKPLAEFCGVYEHPAYGSATISLWDGGLFWEWSGFRGRMAHYAGDEFEVDDENLADNAVSFHIENGAVASLQFLNMRFRKKPLAPSS
jgi:CubicO group peptidase (beta-lactamase class C family)